MLSSAGCGFVAAGAVARAATGRERLDANPIADLQLVRPRKFLARAAIVDGDHVAFADAVLGHVRRAGVADVLALGELLPRNHAAGVPADFAAAAAGRAIDAPNRKRRREVDRLTGLLGRRRSEHAHDADDEAQRHDRRAVGERSEVGGRRSVKAS